MRDCDYINIQGFMRNQLKLKGTELMVYALIYGFSKDGSSMFSGTNGYIANWVGCSRQTVISTLKALCEKDLIVKFEKIVNGVIVNDYAVCEDFIPCQKSLQGVSKNLTEGVKEFDTLITKENSNNNSKKEIVSKDTSKNDDVVEIENAIVRYTGNEKLRSILREFVEYRRKKRSKMSIKAFSMMLNKLRGFTEEEQIDAIETAIISNWTGVFPKHKTKLIEQKPVSQHDEEQQRYEARRKAEADARWAEIERQTALRTEQFRREERGEI